jgi:aspartate/tyrosine/aromatic aminotransferase
LTSDQFLRLRKEFGIYIAPSGRINIADLTMAQVPGFIAALREV